jgi:AraC-like DNA-binding protein
MTEYLNRGYLLEDYKLFHLRDEVSLNEIGYHYHEFHKVLMFMSGNASYVIEGRHYLLSPYDVVLVPRGCVHKPEVGLAAPYERYVLYLSPTYLRSMSGCDLEKCFTEAETDYSFVLCPAGSRKAKIQSLFSSIEEAGSSGEYGSTALGRLLVYELMIELARAAIIPEEKPENIIYDREIVEILSWINDNLTEDISIDSLADRFYISKYHMMRRFRAETGYSIHSYISNKRLLFAHDLLLMGSSVTAACYGCGYKDYSSFSRAYKKQFGITPGETAKNKEAEPKRKG